MTSAELAREMGVHRHTLLKRVRQLNLPGPHATGRPRILAGATRQAFLATCLAHPERTLGSICAEFGITERQGYRLRSQERQALRSRPQRAIKLGLDGSTNYAVPRPILEGKPLKRFIALVTNREITLSVAADAVGLTPKMARRLRNALGLELRKPGPTKGMRRYMRELGEEQRAPTPRRNAPSPLAVLRWRCWRCECLNVEAVCQKCGGTR